MQSCAEPSYQCIYCHGWGASWWRRGRVVASQSEGCGVESRHCPCATGRTLSVPITGLSKTMVCLWEIAHKRPLAILRKE